VIVHNAAICKREDLVGGGNAQVRDQTVSTNVLGPMRLTEALLPHLLKQPAAAVLIVTSGLAFVPAALYPTYSATRPPCTPIRRACAFSSGTLPCG
jgi:uncharacterized oxidoreductase